MAAVKARGVRGLGIWAADGAGEAVGVRPEEHRVGGFGGKG